MIGVTLLPGVHAEPVGVFLFFVGGRLPCLVDAARQILAPDRRCRAHVRVTAPLTAPPEFATFNYADYLARQGVYSLIDRPQVKVLANDQGSPILSIIYGFRNRAYVVIQQILLEPQTSQLRSP